MPHQHARPFCLCACGCLLVCLLVCLHIDLSFCLSRTLSLTHTHTHASHSFSLACSRHFCCCLSLKSLSHTNSTWRALACVVLCVVLCVVRVPDIRAVRPRDKGDACLTGCGVLVKARRVQWQTSIQRPGAYTRHAYHTCACAIGNDSSLPHIACYHTSHALTPCLTLIARRLLMPTSYIFSSLSLSHTHTYTPSHTHTHAHTCVPMHTRNLPTHPLTRSPTHSLAFSLPPSLSLV